MATPNNERGRLIRVQGPALPVVRLTSEAEPSADATELIRVSGPALPVVKLMSEPPMPTATVRLTLPLTTGADGERMFRTLHSLIEKVNEVEALLGRAGVRVDDALSEVRGGEVVIVLAPNDPIDAIETCTRVADLLFATARKTGGATVKVFAAEQPGTPVYELAV